MKIIDSVNNRLIKDLKKLHLKKHRDRMQKFLIEGYHLVEAANQSGVLESVLITKKDDYLPGTENMIVTKDIIRNLGQARTPQNIIGVCRYFSDQAITGQRFLLLDNVQDPGNLGTLIRSALGFNIDCVIVSPDSVDIYNDKVLRSTQGAIFNIKVLRTDLLSILRQLKKTKIKICGTTVNNAVSLSKLTKTEKYALVLGNESRGLNKEVANMCDINIHIETNAALESLNVAVAGSIIMHYFYINQ